MEEGEKECTGKEREEVVTEVNLSVVRAGMGGAG